MYVCMCACVRVRVCVCVCVCVCVYSTVSACTFSSLSFRRPTSLNSVCLGLGLCRSWSNCNALGQNLFV